MDHTEKPKSAPKWATAPFVRFSDQAERLDEVVHLSMQGIAGLQGYVGLIEALAKLDRAENESPKRTSEESIAKAKKSAALAKREVETGFPVLHAQAVVNLWSLLEALIHSFLCTWLENAPNALFVDEIKKLKIRIGEYEMMDKAERISYVVELLEKELAVGLKSSVDRFEVLLAPFGLSGSISTPLRRDIFELAQVRNVIAHKAGIADKKFCDACPWLGIKAGQDVIVNHKMFCQYFQAASAYVTILICRIGEFNGVDMSDHYPDKHASAKPGAA